MVRRNTKWHQGNRENLQKNARKDIMQLKRQRKNWEHGIKTHKMYMRRQQQ